MTSPSDLLKKANTTKYVMNLASSDKMLKNPAFYMQPPTANSSMWMPATAYATQQPAPPMQQPAPVQSSAPAQVMPAYTQMIYPQQPAAVAPPKEEPKPYITIQPPNIPNPMAPRDPAIYKDLMKKHDRFGARHMK